MTVTVRDGALGVVGVLLGVVVLVGCSPVPAGREGPSDLATPGMRWEGGEPSGPLESDPWVQAVRASELNRALAVNAHDFSDPDLWSTTTPALIEGTETLVTGRAKEEPDDHLVVLAPLAFDPIRVDADPSGERATVVVCEFAGTWVSAQDMSVDGEAEWKLYAYEVVKGEDGRLRSGLGELPQDLVDEGERTRSFACVPSQRSIGWFDPVPVVEPFEPEDVVKGSPSGASSKSPAG